MLLFKANVFLNNLANQFEGLKDRNLCDIC